MSETHTEKETEKRRRKDRRHAYRRLKMSIFLRTILITILTGAIGTFIMVYFIDGVLQEPFLRGVTSVFRRFGLSYSEALEMYDRIIGSHKALIVAVFFVILFLIIFYGALSSMTRYLDDVVDSIDNVLEDSSEPITLIHELKPVEDKLNQLKESLTERDEEAAEAEQKKTDILLYLAHDLKTPLTSIRAYLQMLETNPDLSEEERKKYTHIAYEKVLRFNELILEFFDITRFNIQGIELEKRAIDLSLMLAQLTDELYGVLQEKNLRCELQTDEELLAYGDPDKLARVFDNLLRNAVSYSYPGTTITITAREVGEWDEIVFCNRGPTIDEESLGNIFEKFYRADNSRSSSTGGAVLGLAIAKEIVELHDGMISATSEDGETRFIVVLPEQSEEVRAERARRLEARIEKAIEEDKIRKPAADAE